MPKGVQLSVEAFESRPPAGLSQVRQQKDVQTNQPVCHDQRIEGTGRQSGMLGQMHHMMGAIRAGYLLGVVGAAVVNHQILNGINTFQLARQRLQGMG